MAAEIFSPTGRETVDLTGLPPGVAQSIKDLVRVLRAGHASDSSSGNGMDASRREEPGPLVISRPRPSVEELDRLLDELSSGPPGKILPGDFSRADIYDDHD